MINRTTLKEKRNNWLWLVWIALIVAFYYIFPIVYLIEDNSFNFDEKVLFSSIFFCFISISYRVLTYCFNYFLAKIIKKRWKINRLKGIISPIYELREGRFGDFQIIKYSTKYTNLDLQWSIPFSVLFEEQEYVVDGGYFTENIPDNLVEFWEQEYNLEKAIEHKEISAKTIKQQKIDNLNKVFNENYK